MDIPLNVEVRCSDGAGGKSTVIIVHPGTQQVTHFVVDSHGSEYLVPIGAVAESGPITSCCNGAWPSWRRRNRS